MRLQLIESAKTAFYEYYLVGRALAVSAEGLRLLKNFKANAETRYKTGLVPQQDLLQADVELARQEERQLDLEQRLRVAVARLNTLMNAPPDAPLPAPPQELVGLALLPEVAVLREFALTRRPDLQAAVHRLQSEEIGFLLARKEFCPDAEVMAAYDAFWQEKELRAMVGVRINLPVRLDKRHAALAEAQARIAQRTAQLTRLTDQVNFEVQEAYEQAPRRKGAAALQQDHPARRRRQCESGRIGVRHRQDPFLESDRKPAQLDRPPRSLLRDARRLPAPPSDLGARHRRPAAGTGEPSSVRSRMDRVPSLTTLSCREIILLGDFMRCFQRILVVCLVWLTAAGTPLAGMPHFVCRCPKASPASLIQEPAPASSCCCQGCCPYGAPQSEDPEVVSCCNAGGMDSALQAGAASDLVIKPTTCHKEQTPTPVVCMTGSDVKPAFASTSPADREPWSLACTPHTRLSPGRHFDRLPPPTDRVIDYLHLII